MSIFFNRINKIKETNKNILVLVSILVDIAYKNPRTYSFITAILSKFLSLIENVKIQDKILKSITNKFDKIPNTGHIQIWLQRVTIKIDRRKEYKETLCNKVNNPKLAIWNSNWLSMNLKAIITEEAIIDEKIITKIDKIIKRDEIKIFDY